MHKTWTVKEQNLRTGNHKRIKELRKLKTPKTKPWKALNQSMINSPNINTGSPHPRQKHLNRTYTSLSPNKLNCLLDGVWDFFLFISTSKTSHRVAFISIASLNNPLHKRENIQSAPFFFLGCLLAVWFTGFKILFSILCDSRHQQSSNWFNFHGNWVKVTPKVLTAYRSQRFQPMCFNMYKDKNKYTVCNATRSYCRLKVNCQHVALKTP